MNKKIDANSPGKEWGPMPTNPRDQVKAIFAMLKHDFSEKRKTPEGTEILRLEIANMQGIPIEKVKFEGE